MQENLASVAFIKASAYGNDFILIDGKDFDGDQIGLTCAICDRNNGVGADGVEWILPADKSEMKIHLINSDGSYAEISGNGTRCAASYFAAESGRTKFGVETGAGVVGCHMTDREGTRFRFEQTMGVPKVGELFELEIAGGQKVSGVPVSLGNPHFVIFVDKFPEDWRQIASNVQACEEQFPQGVNVEFVRVGSQEEIAILIYERGAGETMSSGTGSSASASAAIALGKTKNTLRVAAPGGVQSVSWDGVGDLLLDGEAQLICKGEYWL